uniref:Uncharacterized protein n=1 Tax=Solanum tuberosum TaxID=4113 RepID=M1D9M6_SOLTU
MTTTPVSSSTAKGKEKEKKIVSCDVKQQYPFKGLTLPAWAFETIPHLRHQVTVKEEISSSRILRWLTIKNVKNPSNLFNPPDDAVVHPWLVPTENELQMSFLITLGLVETLYDHVVDRVKRELVGAITIKRERVDNQLVVLNEDMVDADVRDGVNIGVGVDVDVGDDISFGAGVGGQCVGATCCSRCSGFLCEKCKKYDDDSIMHLQTLSEAVNEFKYKRGVRVISSNKVRDPYTPQAKRRKKIFYQGNT